MVASIPRTELESYAIDAELEAAQIYRLVDQALQKPETREVLIEFNPRIPPLLLTEMARYIVREYAEEHLRVALVDGTLNEYSTMYYYTNKDILQGLTAAQTLIRQAQLLSPATTEVRAFGSSEAARRWLHGEA